MWKENLQPFCGMVNISHDGWCKALKGTLCNCEPDLTVAKK